MPPRLPDDDQATPDPPLPADEASSCDLNGDAGLPTDYNPPTTILGTVYGLWEKGQTQTSSFLRKLAPGAGRQCGEVADYQPVVTGDNVLW
jgi:hypothetical protein